MGMYTGLLEQPRPASLANQGGQRGEGGGHREEAWDSLPPRNIYFNPQKNPAPPTHPISPTIAFSSVVDLSPTVFQDEPFKKTETFVEEEEDLKPCFPF